MTRLCLDINDWLAALPGSSSIITTPTIPELTAYYVILIAAALLLGLPGRTTWDAHIFWTRRKIATAMALAVFFLAADIVWLQQKLQNRDTLRVTFLNVGHASAALVEFPGGSRMLVDGGGSYDDRFDAGRYVVAPFLWHERIGTIDTVVLTHPHPDHVNGLPYIMDNFDVKEVWSNGDEAIVHWGAVFVDKIRQKGIAHRLLTSKSAPIDIGGVHISILNPGEVPLADAELSDREINERAIVMQLRWGEAVIPAPLRHRRADRDCARQTDTGPWQAGSCWRLITGRPIPARSPSCRAVRPETIVISTGRPVREDVLERFRKTGAAVWRTDVHGAVRITTDGRRYDVVPFKSP